MNNKYNMTIKLKIVSDYAKTTRNLDVDQKHKVLQQGISQNDNFRAQTFFIIRPEKGNLYCFYSTEIEILK